MTDREQWFVGVDWASRAQHVHVTDAQGVTRGARSFEHSGAGLAAMAAWLVAVTGAPPEDRASRFVPLTRRA